MKVTLNNKKILENVLFAGDIIRYTILEDDVVSIKLGLITFDEENNEFDLVELETGRSLYLGSSDGDKSIRKETIGDLEYLGQVIKISKIEKLSNFSITLEG